MMIIGVDYHPSFQTIAFFVEETGEFGEQALNHKLFRNAALREKQVKFLRALSYACEKIQTLSYRVEE